MTKEYKFLLVNEEGCQMNTVKTISFAKARKYFGASFGGKYKITWINNDQRNEKT